MKPSICYLCDKPGHEHVGGDWLEFADYMPLPDGYMGHPDGFEYFCDEHIDAAQKLVHLNSDAALAELKNIFGSVQWIPTPNVTKAWYRRLFSRF